MNLELGKKIAVLRKMQGATQAQLADYLMIQPQTVSRWEAEGGTPDITLLPKIAAFFKVSIDELFGLSDMEQLDNLVYKYSVLRDEASFEEVMRRIEIALHSLAEETSEEARQKREQLLAWKVHIYIQKSRQAMQEAETVLDALLEQMEEGSNLYLPLRLQKNQFLIQKGEGREVLKRTKSTWEEVSTVENLYCYLSALMEADRSKEILVVWENDAVQKLIKEVNETTIPLWHILFWSAATECEEEIFEKCFEKFRENADATSVFHVEWMWAALLKKLEREEERANQKEELLQTLEALPVNEYLKMNYRKRIQEDL